MNFDPESLKVKGGHGIAKQYSILYYMFISHHTILIDSSIG